jgi:hypothetical protein
MDTLVTLLFLCLWIVVAFFVLRYFGRRYFHEPRRADVAALAVAVAFAAGALWPFSTRIGGARGAPPQSTAAEPMIVNAVVIGTGNPPGARDTTALCRSAKGLVGRVAAPGSIDDVRSDEQQSATVAIGGQINSRVQYIVDGWASQRSLNRPASGVCLVVDGKLERHVRTYFGLLRPDLATGFHNDGIIPSGYLVIIPPGTLPAGKHRLQMASETAGGLSILPVERMVDVR